MKGLLIPKIRFKGFTDDWEQRKLGEIANSIDTGRSKFASNSNGKYEILGSTSVIGYDSNYDYEGDFLLTARVGANAGELYRHSGKVKISDNTVFIQGENLNFIFYMLTNFDIKKLSFGTGQPLIKASEMRVLELMLPKSNEEQRRIGTFHQQLDNLITLHQRKLDKLKNLKKAYLNKMFPAEDKRKPDLRFKGFTDDWEQRKVSDLGKVYTGNTPSTNKEKYWKENANGFPWITPTDIDNLYVAKGERSLTLAGKNVARVVPENSVLITCIASIGKNAINLNSVAFNQQINAIAPENNDSNFILYFFESDKNKFIQIAGTSATSIINKSMFENYSILAPKLEEQEQIGIIFVKLNNLITLHQRKAECVTKLKISTLIFLMEGDK